MRNKDKKAAPAPAGEIPVVTMTFRGKKISFLLAGTGELVVDWGNGERETVTLEEGSVDDFVEGTGLEVTHKYKESARGVAVEIRGNVTFFDCSGNNITAVDVRKAPGLLYLDCSLTGVSALDVKNNRELMYLCCNRTGVSALDVRNNRELLYLACSDTRMNAAALEALFESLSDRRNESEKGGIFCGGTTASGEELRAAARDKGWIVYHS